MAAPDPTMNLIRSLDDPAKFRKEERVAVFKPHVRHFPEMKLPDGTTIPAQTVVVSDADLHEIARNVNRAYEQDGELVRLTVGHRRQAPGFPEQQQPLVVGFARQYRAEVVERPGGKALRLTHTEYIDRRHEAEAAKYPGRSPDYDPDGKTITGVALLTRDPALALGTVHYDAGSRRVLYAMGDVMADDAKPADWTAEDDVQYAAFCGDMKKYAKLDKYLKKYAAEPGATNLTLPGPGPQAPLPEYSALQRTLAYERAERQLDLLHYEHGVQFDRKVELPKLVGMKTEEERAAHLENMRLNYEKLPVGQQQFLPTLQGQAPTPGKPAAKDAPLTEPEMKLALQYQAEKKVGWIEAIEHAKAQRK